MKTITVKRCMDYMKEWMDCTSVKGEQHNEEYLKFSAKNRDGNKVEMLVNRESSEYHDVWQRPYGSDQQPEWVDSMTTKE